MAHSSSDGHVGYIACPPIADCRKNLRMPSRYLVVRSWQPLNGFTCEKAKALPISLAKVPTLLTSGRCGQEPWVSVALWGRAYVLTAGTFLENVWPEVGCPGRNSQRQDQGWCRCSIGERGNWLLPLGHTAVEGCWCCPGVQALMVKECFVVTPVDMLAVEVANIQAGVCMGTSGWPLVWIASVGVCRR